MSTTYLTTKYDIVVGSLLISTADIEYKDTDHPHIIPSGSRATVVYMRYNPVLETFFIFVRWEGTGLIQEFSYWTHDLDKQYCIPFGQVFEMVPTVEVYSYTNASVD